VARSQALRRKICANEVRAFVGMASCYPHFVKDFASIAVPLHDLTKGKLIFCWSPQADKASTTLKNHLFSLYHIFDSSLPSYTYVSDVGLSVVLTQQKGNCEHVIAYASCNLVSPEKKALSQAFVSTFDILACTYNDRMTSHAMQTS
jgi:hypothetical protein